METSVGVALRVALERHRTSVLGSKQLTLLPLPALGPRHLQWRQHQGLQGGFQPGGGNRAGFLSGRWPQRDILQENITAENS